MASKATPQKGAGSFNWWLPEFRGSAKRAAVCAEWMTRTMSRHDMRRRVNLFNAQLYEDVPALGLGPYQYGVYDVGAERLRMNLVRAVTNTYVAQITSSKPKPRVLTSDGEWSLKKKAKGLQKWFEGRADEIELYDEVSNPCCVDSAIFHFGLAKVYREWPSQKSLWDVGVERTFPWELVVDDAEAQNRKRLRTLGHRRYYDRAEAMEMFPEHRRALQHATRNEQKTGTRDWTVDSAADLIAIDELWRLPTYPDAGDGLHVYVIAEETLFEEAWESMRFPFAFLYRDRPLMGLYGASIPHEIRGLHVDINQTLIDIQECLRLNGKPRIMMPIGTVEKEAWDDDVDSIIEYAGQVPPTLYCPQVMPPEQYQFLWQKWQKGFEQVGISPEQAQGKIDPGVSGSGASIRAATDVRDGRMFRASENFQSWHMTIADLMVDCGRAIAKEKPSYASTWRGKTHIEIVKFRDVDPGKDRYFLRTYPESRLSKNPAQRLAQLDEWYNSKVISQDEYRDLLDFPDLESEDNLVNSPRHLAEKLIERFLDAEDPEDPEVLMYPEPEWPLQGERGIMMRMQFALVRARLDNAPEGNVHLLKLFLGLCDAVLAKANPAPAPGGAPGAPAMPGAPQAPAPPPAPMGVASPPSAMAA